jgi:hypothetical protein
MRTPIFSILALVLPLAAAAAGYYVYKTAKGATNLGEAIAPFIVFLMALFCGAAVGEVTALISLWRAERLGWLSWLGVVGNALLLMGLVHFVSTMGKR